MITDEDIIGVDVGFISICTLSTGEKLSGGWKEAVQYLTDKYKVICIETLSKDISNLSRFLGYLTITAHRKGLVVITVDRYYPSTRLCSKCLYNIGHLSADIREWDCPNCGSHHDRDINAAINIKREGTKLYLQMREKAPTKVFDAKKFMDITFNEANS